jgi:hypothetical protein
MRAEHKATDKIVDGLKFHGQVSLPKASIRHPCPRHRIVIPRLCAHALPKRLTPIKHESSPAP